MSNSSLQLKYYKMDNIYESDEKNNLDINENKINKKQK